MQNGCYKMQSEGQHSDLTLRLLFYKKDKTYEVNYGKKGLDENCVASL